MYNSYILGSHQRSLQIKYEPASTALLANEAEDYVYDKELIRITGENLKRIKSTFFALYNSFFTIVNCNLEVLNCFINKNCNEEIAKLVPAARTILSEEKFGTNAIALSAYKKEVAYVVRDEHYSKNSKKLSCVASPIYLNKKIIGYIGISTLTKGGINGLRAFIETLSQSITEDLKKSKLQSAILKHIKKYEAFSKVNMIFPILTDKERSVLDYVIEGYPNEKIANEMGISNKTVKTYLSRLSDKLGTSSRMDAAMFYLLYEIWLLINN